MAGDALTRTPPFGTSPARGFRPPAWLRGPHRQSILPSLPPRRWEVAWRARHLVRHSRPWLLELGSHGRLRARVTPASASATPRHPLSVALLLHGWEGSVESGYVLSAGAEALASGMEVVRLNLRDHGGTHDLNRELFHSCRLPEVAEAVRSVAAHYADARVHLMGFSLGGNFLLRAAAAPDLPANVANVVAISPVLDPAHTLRVLEHRWVYHQYFVRRWSRSLRAKQRAWPGEFAFEPILQTQRLREMTAALVQDHTEYPGIDDYLNGYAITGRRLASLAVPAQILAAEDDPIIPAADLDSLAAGPLLTVRRERWGGHCGFIDALTGPSFADRYAVAQALTFG